MFLSEQTFLMEKILCYKIAKNEGSVKQTAKFPLCPQSIRGGGITFTITIILNLGTK